MSSDSDNQVTEQVSDSSAEEQSEDNSEEESSPKKPRINDTPETSGTKRPGRPKKSDYEKKTSSGKGRGRPKGSVKPKSENGQATPTGKGRGRPKGSTKKGKSSKSVGRPKGSLKKPRLSETNHTDDDKKQKDSDSSSEEESDDNPSSSQGNSTEGQPIIKKRGRPFGSTKKGGRGRPRKNGLGLTAKRSPGRPPQSPDSKYSPNRKPADENRVVIKRPRKPAQPRSVAEGKLRDNTRKSYKDESDSEIDMDFMDFRGRKRKSKDDVEANTLLEKKFRDMEEKEAGSLRQRQRLSYKDDSESDLESGFESDNVPKLDSSTVKRGRGRPPKSGFIKRGRGRPKLNAGSPVSHKVVSHAGSGRGRPKIPDELKRSKPFVPTGRPRGRPFKNSTSSKPYVPSGRPRGRPKGYSSSGRVTSNENDDISESENEEEVTTDNQSNEDSENEMETQSDNEDVATAT